MGTRGIGGPPGRWVLTDAAPVLTQRVDKSRAVPCDGRISHRGFVTRKISLWPGRHICWGGYGFICWSTPWPLPRFHLPWDGSLHQVLPVQFDRGSTRNSRWRLVKRSLLAGQVRRQLWSVLPFPKGEKHPR